ncbi:hypothetical protein BDN72DRAFT_841787 [Pluteus cervinus]|uniref:Uncharacterized protein n=1 Tax=Pluteus cervinus TaxID=181527 RepID=A0ACD3ASC1_9AGAR|nr:hypothetical protein BDN72DRAFT_841787 [Pluteus cervinus]
MDPTLALKNFGTPVDTIDQIDKEIKALEKRILTLRTARNRLASFSRFPTELLTEIFLLARDGSSEPRGLTVLTISWVCRYWREMSLGTPCLWSYIDFTQLDWVQAFLARSSNAKLDLMIKAEPTDPIVPVFLQALPRIRELLLGAIMDEALSRQWSAPGPVLEHLVLENVDIPDDLLAGQCPVLRHLALFECAFDVELLGSFPNLVELRLTGSPIMISDTVPDVVKVLRSLPRLEVLYLVRILDARPWTHSTAVEPAKLSHLRHLELKKESSATVAALFRLLILPEGTNITLSSLELEQVTDPATLFRSVNIYGCIDSHKVDMLLVAFTPHYLALTLREIGPGGKGNVLRNIALSFRLKFDTPEIEVPRAIVRLLREVPLTHLPSLDISVNNMEAPSFLWSQVFGPLTELRTVKVGLACAQSFVNHIWSQSIKISDEDSQSPKTFPALQTLTVHGMSHNPLSSDFVHLRCALETRNQSLPRLPRLVVIGPPLPDRVVDELQFVVEDLVTMTSGDHNADWEGHLFDPEPRDSEEEFSD